MNSRRLADLAHSHDLQRRRKSARREDGTVWQYDYNNRSEVTGAEKRQANSDLVLGLTFGYNYDGLGNRLSASKGQLTLVTEYEPDAMNRYASITNPGGDDILVKSGAPVDVEVDEDPVTVTTAGNFHGARITADNTTTPAFPEISITGDNDFSESGRRWIPKATFSPTYDDDGNLTNDGRWAYTWDAMNRLGGMTPTTAALAAGVPNQSLSFAYDHLGRRIAKMVTTTTSQGSTIKDIRYLYEGWNVVAQFTADTSNDLTPDATYLWSLDLSGSFHGAGGVGGLHSVNLLSQSESAKLCLACYDANGNIIAWTDSTGRVLQRQDYDPFGNRVIREQLAITPDLSERLEYGFSTKPLDAETGLVYYIHRYYGPRHGRWLSEDPIGVNGGANLYGFVGNCPLDTYDTLGLKFRMRIKDEPRKLNNKALTRVMGAFMTEGSVDWTPSGARSGEIPYPKNSVPKGSYDTLYLFLVTANKRPTMRRSSPENTPHGLLFEEDRQKNSKDKDPINLDYVYLTHLVKLTINPDTGEISVDTSGNATWKWDGVGEEPGDYIAIGAIFSPVRSETNQVDLHYWGIGGWDPKFPFDLEAGPLAKVVGPLANGAAEDEYASGPGDMTKREGTNGWAFPDNVYPEVVYKSKRGRAHDPHRMPQPGGGLRTNGPLPHLKFSVECVNE